MSSFLLRGSAALFVFTSAATPPALAVLRDGDDDVPEAPIARLLEAQSEDVRQYDVHVTTLSDPFMEGRLPGTNGMEVAKQYMQHYWTRSGLQPAFTGEDGAPSWRQPFPLGATLAVAEQHFGIFDGPLFAGGADYNPQSLGGSGEASGELVFVGYSIDNGNDGYSSYAEGDDLEGKIAVMFRYEPMNDEGKSLWSGNRWSGKAGFNNKVRAAADRNAAGIVIVNPPGCSDPRNSTINDVGSSRAYAPCPVLHMSMGAGQRLAEACGHDLMDLRRKADAGGAVIALGEKAALKVKLERKPLVAENVGALLPGKGNLKDEIVVVGAHLDHLGMGNFGSRRGAGNLHPGADDNASGSAAILMIADKLAKDFAKMNASTSARSVLFLAFSGEESGLNGSRFYAANPITDIENHTLMINFDMVGRIVNKRLSVSGAKTAQGMQGWVQHYFDASPLDIVQPANMSGASDHTPFYQKRVPVLFGIIADFHGDYHTPDDVSWKINRVDAVNTVYLFKQIALAASILEDRMQYTAQPRAARRPDTGRPTRASSKVRLGVIPSSEVLTDGGVKIESVSESSSAAEAGVQGGDVLKKWNGKDVGGTEALLGFLSEAKPGEKVQVELVRGGKEVVLWVTLQAR